MYLLGVDKNAFSAVHDNLLRANLPDYASFHYNIQLEFNVPVPVNIVIRSR